MVCGEVALASVVDNVSMAVDASRGPYVDERSGPRRSSSSLTEAARLRDEAKLHFDDSHRETRSRSSSKNSNPMSNANSLRTPLLSEGAAVLPPAEVIATVPARRATPPSQSQDARAAIPPLSRMLSQDDEVNMEKSGNVTKLEQEAYDRQAAFSGMWCRGERKFGIDEGQLRWSNGMYYPILFLSDTTCFVDMDGTELVGTLTISEGMLAWENGMDRMVWFREEAQKQRANTKIHLMKVGGAGGACLAVRCLAAKVFMNWWGSAGHEFLGLVQSILLFHPQSYAGDREHEKDRNKFSTYVMRLNYCMEQVDYTISQACGPVLKHTAWLVRPISLTGAPVRGESGPLWVTFGGNAMTAADWYDFVWVTLRGIGAAASTPDRICFLMVDYPGFGANEGHPSPSSCCAGAFGALQAAAERLKAPKAERHEADVNFLGHSLGSSVASLVASRFASMSSSSLGAAAGMRPCRVVLSAPFQSIEAVAATLLPDSVALPMWAVRCLMVQQWDTEVWACEASAAGFAVSVVHGVKDNLVPVAMGRAVHAAAQKAAKARRPGMESLLLEIPDGDHNRVLSKVPIYARAMGVILEMPSTTSSNPGLNAPAQPGGDEESGSSDEDF